MDPQERVKKLLDAYSKGHETDIILLNAPIAMDLGAEFQRFIKSRKNKRENVLLILVTLGGFANPAYKIARTLQKNYESFTILVPSFCKSAGTIIAVGANKIMFADGGELGPLDVQMSKKDELLESQSGLTVVSALQDLQQTSYAAYQEFLLKTKTIGNVTLKTAAEIATSLTVGLFSPLYAQIDPLHLGEIRRAMSITGYYGKALSKHSENISDQYLQNLISGYPSHDYVIDFDEAKDLFNNVEEVNELEQEIIDVLGDLALIPSPSRVMLFLSQEKEPGGVQDENGSPQFEQSDEISEGSADGYASLSQLENSFAAGDAG